MRIPMMTAALTLAAMLVGAAPAPLTGWGTVELPEDTAIAAADMPLATVAAAELAASDYWREFGFRGGAHYLLRRQEEVRFSYAQLSILPPPSVRGEVAARPGLSLKERLTEKRGTAAAARSAEERLQKAVAYWNAEVLPTVAGNVRLQPYGKHMYGASWRTLGVRDRVGFPRSYRVLVTADGAAVVQGDAQSAEWLAAVQQALAAGKGTY